VSKTIHTQAVQPARHHINVLGQLLKLIPRSLIHADAKETGNEAKARAIAAFGLTPPSRNNLSNADQGRDAKCAGPVFWRTLVRAACAAFVVCAGTSKCSSSK